MIELGGNIKLDGFDQIESGKLVVAKKMIGSFARKISDKKQYKDLTVNLSIDNNMFKIRVVCNNEEGGLEGEKTENNLYFAINGAFRVIMEKFWHKRFIKFKELILGG